MNELCTFTSLACNDRNTESKKQLNMNCELGLFLNVKFVPSESILSPHFGKFQVIERQFPVYKSSHTAKW